MVSVDPICLLRCRPAPAPPAGQDPPLRCHQQAQKEPRGGAAGQSCDEDDDDVEEEEEEENGESDQMCVDVSALVKFTQIRNILSLWRAFILTAAFPVPAGSLQWSGGVYCSGEDTSCVGGCEIIS